jgi:hypothetical protein
MNWLIPQAHCRKQRAMRWEGAIMGEQSQDPVMHQRQLECWLPLVQQISQDLAWGYAPEELEALILATADDLAQTDSATTARAVLWRQHLRQQSRNA